MRRRQNPSYGNGSGWRLILAAGLGLLCLSSATAAQTKAPVQGAGSKQASDDFLAHVNAYVKLRSRLQGTLPKMKATNHPDQLDDHQKALAAKILAARSDAKPGDIFTKSISDEFRERIGQELLGQDARQARQTIRQGDPVEFQVHVNQIYPATLPNTTVPPTLLLKLPKLPRGIEYRIVGRAFALLDVESRMIIDYIPDALPPNTPVK